MSLRRGKSYHNTGGHFQWNLADRCMWSVQRYLPNKLHLDGNHDYRCCIYQCLNKPGEKEKIKVNDQMTRLTMSNSSSPYFWKAITAGFWQKPTFDKANFKHDALQTKLEFFLRLPSCFAFPKETWAQRNPNQCKYRKIPRKPRSHGRILMYRTCIQVLQSRYANFHNLPFSIILYSFTKWVCMEL